MDGRHYKVFILDLYQQPSQFIPFLCVPPTIRQSVCQSVWTRRFQERL